jgi:hypothetical protein
VLLSALYLMVSRHQATDVLQVIFRRAYWLHFWAQLQCEEQTKNIVIAMSRKLEVIALQIANEGWNIFYRLL